MSQPNTPKTPVSSSNTTPQKPRELSPENKLLHKKYLKSLSEKQTCLRCKTLGLRCSFAIDFDRSCAVELAQSSASTVTSSSSANPKPRPTSAIPLDTTTGRPCCSRCFRDGKVFCIAPDTVRKEGKVEGWNEGEGWIVEGASGILVRERIEGLLAPNMEGKKFIPRSEEGQVEIAKKELKGVFDGRGDEVEHAVHKNRREREAREAKRWEKEAIRLERQQAAEERVDEERVKRWREKLDRLEEDDDDDEVCESPLTPIPEH